MPEKRKSVTVEAAAAAPADSLEVIKAAEVQAAEALRPKVEAAAQATITKLNALAEVQTKLRAARQEVEALRGELTSVEAEINALAPETLAGAKAKAALQALLKPLGAQGAALGVRAAPGADQAIAETRQRVERLEAQQSAAEVDIAALEAQRGGAGGR